MFAQYICDWNLLLPATSNFGSEAVLTLSAVSVKKQPALINKIKAVIQISSYHLLASMDAYLGLRRISERGAHRWRPDIKQLITTHQFSESKLWNYKADHLHDYPWRWKITFKGIHFAPNNRCSFKGPFVKSVTDSFPVTFMFSHFTKSEGETMGAPARAATCKLISDWNLFTGT